MSLLVDALREKYASPAEVMRKLGLPTAILGYDAGRPRRARDEEPEAVESSDPAERLFSILKGKLSPAELERVAELLGALSGSEEEGEEGEEERADNDPRDLGDEYEVNDESPAEPSFKRSRSLEPGRTAMDGGGFFGRYPNLRRVSTGGDLWACQPENAPRPQTTIAQDNDFYSRFPLVQRIA